MIERAEAVVAAATRAVVNAEAKAAAAADVLADAVDAVSVAETKVDDFRGEAAKLPWQVAAAEADLAKKKRAHARAQTRHAAAAEKVAAAEEMSTEARAELAQARVTPAAPIPDDADMPPGAARGRGVGREADPIPGKPGTRRLDVVPSVAGAPRGGVALHRPASGVRDLLPGRHDVELVGEQL